MNKTTKFLLSLFLIYIGQLNLSATATPFVVGEAFLPLGTTTTFMVPSIKVAKTKVSNTNFESIHSKVEALSLFKKNSPLKIRNNNVLRLVAGNQPANHSTIITINFSLSATFMIR